MTGRRHTGQPSRHRFAFPNATIQRTAVPTPTGLQRITSAAHTLVCTIFHCCRARSLLSRMAVGMLRPSSLPINRIVSDPCVPTGSYPPLQNPTHWPATVKQSSNSCSLSILCWFTDSEQVDAMQLFYCIHSSPLLPLK